MADFKKVLIIEDDDMWQEIYGAVLKDKGVLVLDARSVEDAEHLFALNADIAAVVVDGQMGRAPIDVTATLVREFRGKGFKGPMIAASVSQFNCDLLLNAGCNYTVEGDKEQTVTMVCKALDLG
jgi:DNA-binding NtrC family response regulator